MSLPWSRGRGKHSLQGVRKFRAFEGHTLVCASWQSGVGGCKYFEHHGRLWGSMGFQRVQEAGLGRSNGSWLVLPRGCHGLHIIGLSRAASRQGHIGT